jgi:tetratricopeptide (TPR) repeat protein
MRKITIVVSLLLLFVLQSYSFAEVKTYIKEYTYNASEVDNKVSSHVTAMREVKKLLLEELGTYLESLTEVKNFELTKDQITSLTAGIVKTEIVDEKWDGHTYWIKTKIVADTDDVIKSIDNLRKDRDESRELEDAKKRSDVLLEANKKLREELVLAKGNVKQEVQQRYDNSIKELSSIEWYESGLINYKKVDYETAVRDYSKAIELNPKYATAYNNRGFAYMKLSKYNEAIIDFDKAIELNSKYATAYNNREIAYNRLNDKESIIDNIIEFFHGISKEFLGK